MSKLVYQKSTVHRQIEIHGLVKKLDIWVQHELKEIHLTNPFNACDMHLKRNECMRIITGDEKCIVYNNVSRKRSWSKHGETAQTTSKADIHQKKVMLSVYFELLQRNRTINSDVYCQQLDKLNAAIKEKRPELINRKVVIFHQDNARPHTSLVTRQKLRELDWELLIPPPYSPDLASSDYHLFRSLQNSLNGETFGNDEAIKSHLVQFFAILFSFFEY